MNRIERVKRVLNGQRPDRPPLSFWYHFAGAEASGQAAVKAHLRHLETWDLDFLKIMNDHGYPRGETITEVQQLFDVPQLTGNEPEFQAQLEVISALAKELQGRVLMTTTVFNAWATLRRMVKEPTTHHLPPNMDGETDKASATLLKFHSVNSGAVKVALDVVARNLRLFAQHCVAAGADGIFMSVREDWLGTGEVAQQRYDELVRDSDQTILSGAKDATFNVLHVCGCPQNLRRFDDYPIHVLNWADRSAGPAIRDVCDWMRPAICAGVDNLATLPSGTPEACAEEARDAIAQAGERPIIISPGCTYDPTRVPRENLEALCRAVRTHDTRM